MNPTKTSFITAAGVTIAALAVVYGSNVRESVELGRSLNRAALTTETTPMGLEASNKQIPEDIEQIQPDQIPWNGRHFPSPT